MLFSRRAHPNQRDAAAASMDVPAPRSRSTTPPPVARAAAAATPMSPTPTSSPATPLLASAEPSDRCPACRFPLRKDLKHSCGKGKKSSKRHATPSSGARSSRQRGPPTLALPAPAEATNSAQAGQQSPVPNLLTPTATAAADTSSGAEPPPSIMDDAAEGPPAGSGEHTAPPRPAKAALSPLLSMPIDRPADPSCNLAASQVPTRATPAPQEQP